MDKLVGEDGLEERKECQRQGEAVQSLEGDVMSKLQSERQLRYTGEMSSEVKRLRPWNGLRRLMDTLSMERWGL